MSVISTPHEETTISSSPTDGLMISKRDLNKPAAFPTVNHLCEQHMKIIRFGDKTWRCWLFFENQWSDRHGLPIGDYFVRQISSTVSQTPKLLICVAREESDLTLSITESSAVQRSWREVANQSSKKKTHGNNSLIIDQITISWYTYTRKPNNVLCIHVNKRWKRRRRCTWENMQCIRRLTWRQAIAMNSPRNRLFSSSARLHWRDTLANSWRAAGRRSRTWKWAHDPDELWYTHGVYSSSSWGT